MYFHKLLLLITLAPTRFVLGQSRTVPLGSSAAPTVPSSSPGAPPSSVPTSPNPTSVPPQPSSSTSPPNPPSNTLPPSSSINSVSLSSPSISIVSSSALPSTLSESSLTGPSPSALPSVVIVSVTSTNGIRPTNGATWVSGSTPSPTSTTETITSTPPTGLGPAAITGIIIAILALAGVAVGVYVIRKFGLKPSSRFRSRMQGAEMSSSTTLGFMSASPPKDFGSLEDNVQQQEQLTRNNTVIMQEDESLYPRTIAVVPTLPSNGPFEGNQQQLQDNAQEFSDPQPQYTYYEHDGYYYTQGGQQLYYQQGYYPQDYYIQPQVDVSAQQPSNFQQSHFGSDSVQLRPPAGPSTLDDQAIAPVSGQRQ